MYFRSLSLVLALFAGGSGPHPAEALRICADPDNLPFSDQQGRGFENRIAGILARDLGATLSYAWRAQRRGFVRKSLDAGACDVVVGVPAGMATLLRTGSYYRSSYVFVTRRDRKLVLHSLDDPRLRTLKVAVQVIGDDGADTPPAFALARRGIIGNVRSYPVPDDAAPHGAAPRIIRAVSRGDVDVALAWGPLAGYWARHGSVPLVLTPLDPDPGQAFLPFVFDIAVGVSRSNPGLRARLDSALARHRTEIARVLDDYGIPRIAEGQAR